MPSDLLAWRSNPVTGARKNNAQNRQKFLSFHHQKQLRNELKTIRQLTWDFLFQLWELLYPHRPTTDNTRQFKVIIIGINSTILLNYINLLRFVCCQLKSPQSSPVSTHDVIRFYLNVLRLKRSKRERKVFLNNLNLSPRVFSLFKMGELFHFGLLNVRSFHVAYAVDLN